MDRQLEAEAAHLVHALGVHERQRVLHVMRKGLIVLVLFVQLPEAGGYDRVSGRARGDCLGQMMSVDARRGRGRVC